MSTRNCPKGLWSSAVRTDISAAYSGIGGGLVRVFTDLPSGKEGDFYRHSLLNCLIRPFFEALTCEVVMDEEPHRRRRRPALSCLPCRRRKIKCDRVNPCGRCVSTKTRCTYRMYGGQSQSQDECERDTTSSDPGTYATPPVGRTQVAGRDTLTAGPGQLSASTPVAPLSDQPNSANDHAPDTSLQDIAQRLRKLEEASQASPIHSLSETGRHILTRQAGIGDSEICLKKTRLLRWSDWMGVAPEVGRIQLLVRSRHIETDK